VGGHTIGRTSWVARVDRRTDPSYIEKPDTGTGLFENWIEKNLADLCHSISIEETVLTE